LPQAWGAIVAKALTDPVWFFITDWFPLYLVAKGISLKSGLVAIWIPFIAADLGNFFGGITSGHLIKRGWSLGAARKALVVFGGIGVTFLIPTIFTANLAAIAALFGLATFCYAAFSTIANVLPSDLFTGGAVASVSGLSGTGAGIGTIIAVQVNRIFFGRKPSSAWTILRQSRHRCRTGAVCGNDSCPAARTQHARDRAGTGAPDMMRSFSG